MGQECPPLHCTGMRCKRPMRYTLSVISWREQIFLNLLWRQDEKEEKSGYGERRGGKRQRERQRARSSYFLTRLGAGPDSTPICHFSNHFTSNSPSLVLAGHNEFSLPVLKMRKQQLGEFPVCQGGKKAHSIQGQSSRERKDAHDLWVKSTFNWQCKARPRPLNPPPHDILKASKAENDDPCCWC